MHEARTAIAAGRRLRLVLVCLACSLGLVGGGWLMVRHSSLVSVDHVTIRGLSGAQAPAIEHALSEAARGMSTMDVNSGALRAAVAGFPVVQEVRASTSFPHSMHIFVVEQHPVATLVVSGMKTAMAANGVALGPELLSSSLPMLTGSYEPARGQRLHNVALLESLSVLGAAAPMLEKLVARVYMGPRGLTVAMKSGLLVYFGDASRPHAKWLSLARVLSDHSSVGALYVDVRLPGRPAAGMSSEATAGPTAASAHAATPGAQESTVSALVAGLKGAKAEAPKEAEKPAGVSSGESSSSGESRSTGSTASGTESAPAGQPEASPAAPGGATPEATG